MAKLLTARVSRERIHFTEAIVGENRQVVRWPMATTLNGRSMLLWSENVADEQGAVDEIRRSGPSRLVEQGYIAYDVYALGDALDPKGLVNGRLSFLEEGLSLWYKPPQTDIYADAFGPNKEEATDV